MRSLIWTVALALGLCLAGCKGADGKETERSGDPAATEQSGDPAATAGGLTVSSTAFADGEPIPARFTCDGDDLSPALAWTAVPEGTASLALICDDPDAPVGTWQHWVLFDLPPEAAGLPEGARPGDTAVGGLDGHNSWKKPGYGGPCPPKGQSHRYFFRVYALDARLELEAGATRKQVDQAMVGHVLGEGVLMGTYQRAQ